MIDTLSQGFGQVNRVIWILLLPVSLNVLLWQLPSFSLRPLVERWLRLYQQAVEMTSTGGTSSFAPLIDQQMLDGVSRVASEFNLLSLLGTSSFYMGASPFLPWNVVKAWLPIVVPQFGAAAGGAVEVGGIWAALALLICLPLIGLFFGTLYVSVIGAQVRDGRISVASVFWTAIRSWGCILGFVALFIGAIFALMIPLSLVVGLLSLVAPSVAVLVYASAVFFLLVLEFWTLIYLFFLVDAIVIGGYGPLRAVKSSLLVVRQGLWSAMGLISLTLFISLGLQVVWGGLSRFAWGMPVAILGDAYVASGLVAASMIHYRSRAVLA